MRAWEMGVLGELAKTRKLQERQFRWDQQQAAAQLAEQQMGPMERGFRDYQRTQLAVWNAMTPAQQQAMLAARGAPPVTHRPASEVAIEVLAWTWVVLVFIGRGFRAAWRWLVRLTRRAARRLQRRV